MKIFTFLLLCLALLTSCTRTSGRDNEAPFLKKETPMRQKNFTPEHLYKIVSTEQWEESLRQNQMINSPMDEDFIHLAKEDQLPHVAQKFWSHKDYVILKLDSKKLTGRLVYESNPGGTTLYYHLYEGTIPLDAILEVSAPK